MDEPCNHLSPITRFYDTRWNEEEQRFTSEPNEAAMYPFELAVLHADILNMMSDEVSKKDKSWHEVAADINIHVRYADMLLPWYISHVGDDQAKITWATEMVETLDKKYDEMMAREDKEEKEMIEEEVPPLSQSCPILHTFDA